MSNIKPFRGYRPVAGKAAAIASPPYDVLSSEEAKEMAAGNPVSFLHVVKPEIDLPAGTDVYADIVYATGAENLRRLIDDGHLVQDAAPCLYIYRQIMQVHGRRHVQTGVMAGCSVAEYEAGLIKRHEFTRVAKEKDRTRHVEELNANTGPVFLTYRARDEVKALVASLCAAPPDCDFTAPDGIGHVLWVVKDPAAVEQLCTAFCDVPALYIADGHHRCASACTVGKRRRDANPAHTGDEPYNHLLAVMFPHDELMILDYNRVVMDLNGMTSAQFMERVKEKFTCAPAAEAKPAREHTFGMYLDGRWYTLEAKNGTFDATDPVRRLDVSILQENLLSPVLAIGDPRTDDRIDFIGGIRGMKELERRVKDGAAVAFAMFPTPIEQLMAIADAGEVMPPKSTWFEPKLRSGLVVRPLW